MNITEALESWENEGKKALESHFVDASDDEILDSAYKFVLAICDGQVTQNIAIDFIKAVLEARPTFLSDFADVLWLVCVECEGNTKREKELFEFLNNLVSYDVIERSLLKERLETKGLEGAKLVDVVFAKNIVRVNTKLLYQQQKFNLFVEENEGYAKLITEMIEGHEISDDTVPAIIAKVDSFVGQFDLDPNRVLDIVLEGLEHNLDKYKQYLRILDEFRGPNIAHILGFKFKFFQGAQSPSSTPESLYITTARLIEAGMLSLDQIWSHLTPEDDEAVADYQLVVKSKLEEASKIGVVSLNPKGDKKDEKTEIDMDAIDSRRSKSQKLGLLMGLLSIRHVKSVEFLLSILHQSEPCSYQPVSQAMCALIGDMIAPLYARVAPRSRKIVVCDYQCRVFEHLCSRLYSLLHHLSCWLSSDVVLFTKLCRIIEGWAREGIKDEYMGRLGSIVSHVLLPALNSIEKNPGASYELYDALHALPWQNRYEIYSMWMKDEHMSHYSRRLSVAVCSDETKKIMRRVTKENVKQQGKQLGQLTHSDPYTPLSILIEQVQSYDNMITVMVDALKYLSSLSLDIFTYVLIENLSSPDKIMLKKDGLSLSDWLQAISQLCAQVCSRYPHRVELGGLLQHLLNRLKDGSSFELIVLKDLVTKMAGLETVEDISLQQAEALAGGAVMRSECAMFVNTSASNGKTSQRTLRSTSRLVDVLTHTRISVPLLIAIAQARSAIIFATDVGHLKLVGDMYDKCHEMLIQLTEFLTRHNSDGYGKHMPSLPDLVKIYHLPTEVAFFVCRPALKQLLPSMNVSPLLTPWPNVTPQLYLTFWELDLSDIYVPIQRYEAEIERHEKAIVALDALEDPDDRQEKKKRESDKKGHVSMITRYKSELEVQKNDHNAVIERLNGEKEQYFNDSSTIEDFLQYCVIPRCAFSPTDALYCAHFASLLHNISTPNFPIMRYYGQILQDVSNLVFSSTMNEASRLGRFLHATLSVIAVWKSDISVYEKECFGKPGFIGEDNKVLSYTDFIRVEHHWQRRLCCAFCSCLESDDYMDIRNALVVLTKIVTLFPKTRTDYSQILAKAERLKNEQREDLRIIGLSYLNLLNKIESTLESDRISLTARVKEKMATLNTEERHKRHRDRREWDRDKDEEGSEDRKRRARSPVRRPRRY